MAVSVECPSCKREIEREVVQALESGVPRVYRQTSTGVVNGGWCEHCGGRVGTAVLAAWYDDLREKGAVDAAMKREERRARVQAR